MNRGWIVLQAKYDAAKICSFLYLLYFIFLIFPIESLISSEIIFRNTPIYIFKSNTPREIGEFDIFIVIFMLLLLSFLYYGLQTILNEIIIIEDENNSNKINKKLILYKLFIVITIILNLTVLYITKDITLIITGLCSIFMSLLICFAMKVYFIACLYDRKTLWLESVSGVSYGEVNKKSGFWKYKIWHDPKEKVEFKYRKKILDRSILYIIIFSLLFIRFIHTPAFLPFCIFVLYFVPFHVLSYIDSAFNLFTSLEGTCTEIYKSTTKNESYYCITVTDFNKERKLEFTAKEDYSIKQGDNLYVVHAVTSKKVVSVNSTILID